MAGYKSTSFDPDVVGMASDAASKAINYASGASDAASAAMAKAAAASSAIAAHSSAWLAGGDGGGLEVAANAAARVALSAAAGDMIFQTDESAIYICTSVT